MDKTLVFWPPLNLCHQSPSWLFYILAGKLWNKNRGIGYFGCCNNLFICGILLPQVQIIFNGIIKIEWNPCVTSPITPEAMFFVKIPISIPSILFHFIYII